MKVSGETSFQREAVADTQKLLKLLEANASALTQVTLPGNTGRDEALDAKTHLAKLKAVFMPMCVEYARTVRAKLAAGEVTVPKEEDLNMYLIRFHKLNSELGNAFVQTWLESVNRGDEKITPETYEQCGEYIEGDTKKLAELSVAAEKKCLEIINKAGITDPESIKKYSMYLYDVGFSARHLSVDNEKETVTFNEKLILGSKNLDSFYWGPEGEGEVQGSPFFSHVISPVGEYGEDLARRIFIANRMLFHETADEKFFEMSKRIADENRALIENTARGKDKVEIPAGIEIPPDKIDQTPKLPFEEAPLRTLVEGLGTLTKSVSLLASQKLPGYENPDSLVEAIVRDNLLSQLAKIIGPGVINPLSIGSRNIKDLVVVKDDGTLEINPEIEKKTDRYRVEFRDQPIGGFRPIGISRGCPVAYRPDNGNGENEKSGIQVLADLFLDIFKLTGKAK